MKLEIGPGDSRLGDDWKTLDCIRPRRHGVDFIAEWGEERLPIPDGIVEIVFASHVLEHVAWHRTHCALQEVHRILRPGGVFEVWVPNFAVIVQSYLSGVPADDWRKHNPTGDCMTWINGRLFTYGPSPNWHRACFDRPHLEKCLRAAGFIDIAPLDKPRGYDHGAINLGLRGVKP